MAVAIGLRIRGVWTSTRMIPPSSSVTMTLSMVGTVDEGPPGDTVAQRVSTAITDPVATTRSSETATAA